MSEQDAATPRDILAGLLEEASNLDGAARGECLLEASGYTRRLGHYRASRFLLTAAGELLPALSDRADLACRWAFLLRDELDFDRAISVLDFAFAAGREISVNSEGRAFFTRALVLGEVPMYRKALADLASAEQLLASDEEMLAAVAVNRASFVARSGIAYPGAEEGLDGISGGLSGIVAGGLRGLFAWRRGDLDVANAALATASLQLMDLEYVEMAGVALLDLACLAADRDSLDDALSACRAISDIASSDAASIRVVSAARCLADIDRRSLVGGLAAASVSLRRRWQPSARI